MLLKALLEPSQRSSLRLISTKVETNPLPSLNFFQNAGFKPWYTELILCHSGERQPGNDLVFVSYQSKYFGQYVHALRESFYELRSSNDFEPYYCCEPNQEKQEELEHNKDHIFLLLDGERLAASFVANGDSIDDVFVVPAYQGRGIGKKMMHYAVNTVLDSGKGPAELSAIAWNVKALHLYQSIGFRISKTIHYLRLFV